MLLNAGHQFLVWHLPDWHSHFRIGNLFADCPHPIKATSRSIFPLSNCFKHPLEKIYELRVSKRLSKYVAIYIVYLTLWGDCNLCLNHWLQMKTYTCCFLWAFVLVLVVAMVQAQVNFSPAWGKRASLGSQGRGILEPLPLQGTRDCKIPIDNFVRTLKLIQVGLPFRSFKTKVH